MTDGHSHSSFTSGCTLESMINSTNLLPYEIKLNVLCVEPIQESSSEYNAELYIGELYGHVSMTAEAELIDCNEDESLKYQAVQQNKCMCSFKLECVFCVFLCSHLKHHS